MENISSKVKIIGSVIFLLIVLTGMFTLVNTNQKNSQTIEELQEETTHLKSQNTKLSSKYTQLSEQYDLLNKEKNGSANKALLTATKELFQLVYSYDTGKKAESVAARKEKAKPYANTSTLDTLFSKDPEKLTPTVSTISILEGEPEVYRMSSNAKELTAMVLVNYSLSIAESEKQEGKFMYQIVFDPMHKQVTGLKNIGEISIP